MKIHHKVEHVPMYGLMSWLGVWTTLLCRTILPSPLPPSPRFHNCETDYMCEQASFWQLVCCKLSLARVPRAVICTKSCVTSVLRANTKELACVIRALPDCIKTVQGKRSAFNVLLGHFKTFKGKSTARAVLSGHISTNKAKQSA